MPYHAPIQNPKELRSLALKLLKAAYRIERGEVVQPARLATMDHILAAVAAQTGKDARALRGTCRKQEFFIPRSEAMRQMHDECGYSLNEIGRFFSGRDHTSVLHAVRQARLRREMQAPMSEAAE